MQETEDCFWPIIGSKADTSPKTCMQCLGEGKKCTWDAHTPDTDRVYETDSDNRFSPEPRPFEANWKSTLAPHQPPDNLSATEKMRIIMGNMEMVNKNLVRIREVIDWMRKA